MRLAGWAMRPTDQRCGLKSLVPKWGKNIQSNPAYFKGWVSLASRAKPILTTLNKTEQNTIHYIKLIPKLIIASRESGFNHP